MRTRARPRPHQRLRLGESGSCEMEITSMLLRVRQVGLGANQNPGAARTPVHPYVVGNGARRLRRFDAARSPALAESSKFVGSLTLKRPEGRAPKNRQLVDALHTEGPFLFNHTRSLQDLSLLPRKEQMKHALMKINPRARSSERLFGMPRRAWSVTGQLTAWPRRCSKDVSPYGQTAFRPPEPAWSGKVRSADNGAAR